MADTVAPQRRSEIMSHIRAKGMKPEMRVRQLAHSMGYRYPPTPERPSGQARHGLPGPEEGDLRSWLFLASTCQSCLQDSPHPPSPTGDYWLPKLERNASRDAEHMAKLDKLGWEVLILWECEVEEYTGLRERIRKFLTQDTT